MKILNFFIDGYDRKARLYPAIACIAPLAVTFFAIIPTDFSTLKLIVSGWVAAGGAFLLSQVGRDSGKKEEKTLFKLWGGMPSIAIFRHRNMLLDPITKERYHERLATLVGTETPSPEKEQSDPETADKIYSAWSNYLRVNTRDTKKYNLLFQENVSFGYRRNLWGLRSYGKIACVISFLIAQSYVYQLRALNGAIDINGIAAFVISVLLLLFWIFWVSPDWIKIAADAYAMRLAETVDTFELPPCEKTERKKEK